MANRIKKYNPAFLSPEELIRSFVVRHTELELVVQVIRENTGDSNQHVLVIGPRGIGKTMLVLRVVEQIRAEEDLQGCWYPLVFGEESYQVSTPGEFWLEALFHLAHKTGEERWRQTYKELRDERDEERLRERALAQLMDFADGEGKRILLVVENFNMLLGEQMSSSDAWKLRHTLSNERRIMLLATATHYFRWEKRGALGPEIKNSGKAMFELFKLYELGALDEDECGELWASVSGKKGSDERVRPLQILTGGNPRLLAIISTFAARMSLKELMDDLMQLVDDHTEYFKTHLESLPTVERRVYLGLAELWDPVPARKVAEVARLEVSKTSSLLKRLIERGVVVEADGERRSKLYQVSERMYNIYYLMRRRGAPSRRVKALVRFIVPFYGPKELVSLTQRIAEEACKLEPERRREHFWAYEAILDTASVPSLHQRLIEAAPHRFFNMPDIPPSIKQHVQREKAKKLEPRQAEFVKLLDQGEDLEEAGKLTEAEVAYRKAIATAPENATPWAKLGNLLHKVERYEEAENACREAIRLDPDCPAAWLNLGCLLVFHLHRLEGAGEVARRIVELLPEDDFGWVLCGYVHQSFERYVDAEETYRTAIKINEKSTSAWANLGVLLHKKLGRYEEAERAYRKVVEIDEKDAWAWTQLGQLLHEKLERYEEAEGAYRKALEIDDKYTWAWAQLGQLLHEKLERYEEAEKALREATRLQSKWPVGWIELGALHESLKRYSEAEKAYRKALELGPDVATGWTYFGGFLERNFQRYEEAEKAFRRAIQIDREYAPAWAALGSLLHEKLDRYEEAEEAYRKAIETDEKAWVWVRLGLLLHEKLERYGEAERAYRKASELEPEVAWGYEKLGQLLHEKLERYEEAEKAYRRAIEVEPKHFVAVTNLVVLLQERGRTIEAVKVAEECLSRNPNEATLLNSLAWAGYEHRMWDMLAEAEVWAKRAVELEPNNGLYLHTLASILCISGKEPEALEGARKYLKDKSTVEKTINDAIDLFIGLAAAGYGREALNILKDSPSAEILEPLVVGLRMYVGEDVKAAAEIMEVGRDVVKRIEERRERIEAEQTGEERSAPSQE